MHPFSNTSKDRFKIWNIHTNNLVETWNTDFSAIRASRILNEHNVEWNKSFPRYIVIDSTTGQKFFTDLDYML